MYVICFDLWVRALERIKFRRNSCGSILMGFDGSFLDFIDIVPGIFWRTAIHFRCNSNLFWNFEQTFWNRKIQCFLTSSQSIFLPLRILIEQKSTLLVRLARSTCAVRVFSDFAYLSIPIIFFHSLSLHQKSESPYTSPSIGVDFYFIAYLLFSFI